jgi:hypothetical protein
MYAENLALYLLNYMYSWLPIHGKLSTYWYGARDEVRVTSRGQLDHA